MTPAPSQPAVSIIVPIYGVEKYLRRCVDSILAQTLPDMEILLVDDGSPDACPQIADEYAAKDARVRVIHKANGGYGQTCNVGLDAVRGEYIAIAEPDDYMEKTMYGDLYVIAKENGSDIVKSAFNNFWDLPELQRCEKMQWNTEGISPHQSFTIKEHPQFLFFHPSVWTCIYKADFLRRHNIRFIEAPGAGWTDNPFQVQTLCLAEKINYTDKAYYYWRRTTDDDAKDLKDWTLPFKRSEDIHQWLKEHHIEDRDTLACLYLRELSYIDIALRSVRLRRHQQLKPAIDRMLERMNPDILNDSPYVRKRYRKMYALFKRGQYLRHLYGGKQLRRILCSAKFRKDGYRIQFLGVQIATPLYRDLPALLRIRMK